jgi:hypothetical protein
MRTLPDDTAFEWCFYLCGRIEHGAAAGGPGAAGPKEVNVNMRKFFALCLIALLSLTLALALVSCGQKAEQPAQNESAPADQSMMADTSTMHDSMMVDTSTHK